MGTDGIGFTTGQKARIYSHYLGIRRGLKNLAGCLTTPVKKRDLPDNVIEMLKEDDQNCLATFYTPLNPDPSLEPPPDPQYPFYPVIAVPQREPIPWLNPDDPPTAGSADPLGGYTEFENGDGKAVTQNQDHNQNQNNQTMPSNQTCPASCNVHQNSCDRPSAQTCIYPSPFAANPRGACACQPGYRAADPTGDVKRMWRLDLAGIEHMVWVAEGVPCTTICKSSPGNCGEVGVVPKSCAG